MNSLLRQWWHSSKITADHLRWKLANPQTPGQSHRAKPLRLGGLEKRLLMSATPIDPAALQDVETINIEQASANTLALNLSSDGQTDVDETAVANELETVPQSVLVFVDGGVSDIEELLDDLRVNTPHAEVYVLDSNRDGIEQISSVLGERLDVDAVHIVSHSDGDAVRLGNTWLRESNLDGYAGQIASWGGALATDADLLFYGCDLAGTASGQQLLESVASLTGADVAASTDDTGHADYGGNWSLEHQLGDISTGVIFSTDLQSDWLGKLAVINVTTTADIVDSGDGLISLREAVNDASDGDTILLVAGDYQITIDGNGNDAGDIDVNKNVTITGSGVDATSIDANRINRAFEIKGSNIVTITDLTIHDGSENDGGAIKIANNASLTLQRVVIRDSVADNRGAAIFNDGTLSITDARIVDNQSSAEGGGIFTKDTLTLTNVSLEGNTATTGAGVYIDNGTATLTNATVSGNQATSNGGGIYNRGTTTLTHVTITNNFGPAGGGVFNSSGTTTLSYSIVADNSASSNDDLQGNFTSGGHNLIGAASNVASFGGTDTTGIANANLSALADNGGYSYTHAIAAGNAAVDAATGSTTAVDARHLSRPADGDNNGSFVADIGSFELAAASNVIVVTTTSDDVDTSEDSSTMTIAELIANPGSDGISLREAILAANNTTNVGGPDEIRFNIAGSGVHRIMLGSRLDILDAVIIDGFSQTGANINAPKIELDGQNITGSFGLRYGIVLKADNSVIRGLSIFDVGTTAIRVDGFDNNTIQGNWIGVRADGTVAGGASVLDLNGSTNTLVGGTGAQDHNVFAGGSTTDLSVRGDNNRIVGNNFGVNSTGDAVLHSGKNGILFIFGGQDNVIGGSQAGEANVFGGYEEALTLDNTGLAGNEIYGNLFGTDATRTLNFANQVAIELQRGDVTIGDVTAGSGNVIANSSVAGIVFQGDDSTNNRFDATIRGNSFYNNAQAIDLGDDGITANDLDVGGDDTDDGPNRLMNFPELSTAQLVGGSLVVTGNLRAEDVSGGELAIVDFYATETNDRQGRTYLGSETLTLTGGSASFNTDLGTTSVPDGWFVTATATAFDGSTSEFSSGTAVTSINSAPTDIDISNQSINENTDTSTGSTIGVFTATDLDLSDTHAFSIVGGADAAKFTIGGAGSDELILTDGVLDYETQREYIVDIEATDSGSNSIVRTFSITVNDDHSDGFITVTTVQETNDTGSTSFDAAALIANQGTDSEISLAEAIIAANNTAGTQTIRFDIDGTGPHVIQVLGVLPEVSDAVVIDGTTQDGFIDRPTIFIQGNDQLQEGIELGVGSDGSTIRGLGIQNFGYNAIEIRSDGNTIVGNWLGAFDPNSGAFDAALGNGHSGIWITSSNNIIGGTDANDRNVVGGSGRDGISVWLAGTVDNQITGNWIGITPDGLGDAAITLSGIDLQSSSERTIVSGNVVGNADDGITISDSSNNIIVSNFIGTDASEARDIGNGAAGIQISGTSDGNIVGRLNEGNVIVNNTLDGIRITDTSDGNSLTHNRFGGNAQDAIDLGGDGPTNNDGDDSDSGPNQRQNHPGLSNATITDSGDLSIDVAFNSAVSSTFTIHVYQSDADGEPIQFIGSTDYNTDAGGDFTGTFLLSSVGVSEGDRLVATLTDSNANTSEVSGIATLTRLNITPTLASIESAAIDYVENQPAAVVSNSLVVTDPDTQPLVSATVTLNGYQSGEDSLVFINQNGITGSFDSGTGVLNLSGNASASVYQTALRSIQYLNNSENPSTATRTIEFSVADADVSSGTISRSISVQRTNDPTLGSPVIPTTAQEDTAISVDTSGISDADGLGTFSYQWFADGVLVGGATADSFTPDDAQVGSLITVQVSFQDGMGNSVTLDSNQSNTVTNVDDAPTGSPSITGSATEDATLTADTSGLNDADGLTTPNFQYQWLRNGVAIAGQNAATYTLGDADVGENISVDVTFTDDTAQTYTRTSAAVGPIANLDDAPTGVPAITGSATEDATLTADTSGLNDADGLTTPNFQYQWLRNGVAIAGQNAATYTLGDADVGENISVDVTFTDDTAQTYTRTSAAVGPIANLDDAPTGVPAITGSATEDATLTADTSGIDDADGLNTPNFQYQWLRNGVAIAGQDAATYTLGDADVGENISVDVTFTDDTAQTYTRTSAAVGPITNLDDAPTGVPTITGSATEDATLTADTSGLNDADGLTTPNFQYQWLRNGVAIAGQNAATYTLGDADVGENISVYVTFTDDTAQTYTRTSAAVGPITNLDDAPTGVPAITGSATEDATLTADTSGIDDADGFSTPNFQYQWLRNGVAIAGQNSASYTLGDDDVGQNISVEVTFTDDTTETYTRTSAAVGPVANLEDIPTGAPSINGNAIENESLTADTSGIDDPDGLNTPNFQYQWLRNGVAIAGQNSASYTLGDDDVGANISVEVTFTDDTAETYTRTSAAVGPVANVSDSTSGQPTIDGNAIEDQVLSANTSSISDPDGLTTPNYRYQWQRDGADISGATSETYTLDDIDVGSKISVQVTLTDDSGAETTLTSSQTASVVGINDAPTGRPAISGTITENETISATLGTLADPDGLPTNAQFQWVRSGVDIAGATGVNYVLTQSDVGEVIRVRLTYVDLQGTTETVISQESPPVADQANAPTMSNRTRNVPFGQKLAVGTRLFENASNDADGDVLTAVLVTPPDQGVLTLLADGSFLYEPEADFFGSVSFTWQATDGVLTSNVATVTIVVAPPLNTRGSTEESYSETSGQTDTTDSPTENEPSEETPDTERQTGPTNDTTTAPITIGFQENVTQDPMQGEDEDEDGRVGFGFRAENAEDQRNQLQRSSLAERHHQFQSLAEFRIASGLNDLGIPTNNSNGNSQMAWATYAMLSQPGEMWNELDSNQLELESLFASERMIVGTVGAATSGLTVAAFSWLRGGFLVLGLWQQRPLLSQIDPIVLMQGLRSKDNESLADIMANEKKKLDQSPKADITE